MKNTIAVLIAGLLMLLTLSACSKNPSTSERLEFNGMTENNVHNTVYLKDKGLESDKIESAKKNTDIINKAIKNADENTKIIIPDGTYYIKSRITFSNKQNIILCGDKDSRLINTAYSPIVPSDKPQITYTRSNIFAIEKSRNITVSNLTLDYAKHSTVDGVITSVQNGKTYFQAFDEFIGGSKTPISGGELCFSALIANDKVFYDEKWFDNGSNITKENQSGLFSLPSQFGKVGDRICCRISNGTYSSPLIYISESSGIDINDITSSTCPSAFIYAPYGNSNFNFSGLNISVGENSERLLASNEDMIHIKQLSGYLKLSDSTFIGLGDDVLNIHSKLCKISSIDESKVSVIMPETGEKPPIDLFLKDDKAEFFDTSGNSLGTTKVLSYKRGEIEFDSIPEGVTNGCFIQNISNAPETVIENCNIGFGRARGVLLQTKNATVKNCSFSNLRLPAILISPDFDYWYEAGYSENISIENNSFHNCASLDSGFGVIHIGGCHDNPSFISEKNNHKNVSIKNNVFTNCNSEYVKATGVNKLTSDM